MSAIGNPVFAVGQYTTLWNAVPIGLFEGDDKVPTLIPTNKAFSVDNTDAWGKTTIERFYMGYDWQARFTMLEWALKTKAVLFPFSGPAGTPGLLNIIGIAHTDLAQVLLMNPITGTPAAVAGPLSITANKAILGPNNNPALMFGPILRKIAVTMDLFPYMTGTGGTSAPGHFVVT